MNRALAANREVGETMGYVGPMPILPPEDENEDLRSSGISLPGWMWDRLEELTKAKKYKSRNRTIQRLLAWAFQAVEHEEKLAAARDEATSEVEKFPSKKSPKK
jgi:hypothetical protein